MGRVKGSDTGRSGGGSQLQGRCARPARSC